VELVVLKTIIDEYVHKERKTMMFTFDNERWKCGLGRSSNLIEE